MKTELQEFEESMRRQISAFQNPKEEKKGPRPMPDRGAKSPGQSASSYKTGHLVRLAVRTRALEQDSVFEHHSSSISKLEAQLEAEKAAKKAGYPIIGHLIEIRRL
ncbi:hypothetical protein DU490_01205 [Halomonas sp. DQ26W]|uniref:hypothetical protein n=1 Tax=Halomonas sp. DQ26W TaxID=2282311 RepID=UPI000DF7FB23|nr:hypothetical protein [Halomonas sp. DQ26W]RDB44562.1 hypothetical protein DU490_01205 [Halomonas sp. DQ26W]